MSLTTFKLEAEAPLLTPQQIYENELDVWVEKVRWEESRGQDMLVILDTNNKYSHGCLQYQMQTWLDDSKKYKVEGEMMDCNKQKELAKKTVMAEPENGWRRWYTTVVKKGVGKPPLPPQSQ